MGLPDNAVKVSRERIKAALKNCGFSFPYGQGVTINLAPADIRKEDSAFDLPMALGLTGVWGSFLEAVGQDDVPGRVVTAWHGAIRARRVVGDAPWTGRTGLKISAWSFAGLRIGPSLH